MPADRILSGAGVVGGAGPPLEHPWSYAIPTATAAFQRGLAARAVHRDRVAKELEQAQPIAARRLSEDQSRCFDLHQTSPDDGETLQPKLMSVPGVIACRRSACDRAHSFRSCRVRPDGRLAPRTALRGLEREVPKGPQASVDNSRTRHPFNPTSNRWYTFLRCRVARKAERGPTALLTDLSPTPWRLRVRGRHRLRPEFRAQSGVGRGVQPGNPWPTGAARRRRPRSTNRTLRGDRTAA